MCVRHKKDVTFSNTNLLKNDGWSIQSVCNNFRFIAMAELGSIWRFTYILPYYLNWFYLAGNMMGMMQGIRLEAKDAVSQEM